MAKIHVPLAGGSKLSPKFTGPYKIIDIATGNKYKIQDLETREVSIRHEDDLKKTSMKLNLAHETHDEDEPTQADATHTDSVRENEDNIDDNNDMHEYRKKLRSHTQRLRQSESNGVLLVCNITEFFLQN